MIAVLSPPICGDGALEFRAFIGDRQSRSGYRTFELIGIHAPEFMCIQKITVILPSRHHDAVVRRGAIWVRHRRTKVVHKALCECVKGVGDEASRLLGRAALGYPLREIACRIALEADRKYAPRRPAKT